MSSQDGVVLYLPLEDDSDQAYAMSRPRKNYAVLLNDEKSPRSNRGLPGVVHVGGGCDLARCANAFPQALCAPIWRPLSRLAHRERLVVEFPHHPARVPLIFITADRAN